MTASEKARFSQYGSPSYPGVDNWTDSSLHKGNIVYCWEGDNQTSHNEDGACVMTPQTAFDCEGDPNKLRDSIQTDLNPDYDNHRGVLRAYEMNGDVDAAFSHCEANKCHGAGGGEQYYIPDFDDLQDQGLISHREDLDLHFDEDKLPINQEDKDQDQINTQAQTKELPKQLDDDNQPIPTEGTTPTLEGAYSGETEGLGDSMKNQVDDTNDMWNGQDYYNGMGW